MNDILVSISFEEIFKSAEKYFLETSGLDRGSDKKIRMLQQAMQVYDDLTNETEIKAVIKCTKPDGKHGQNLDFEGIQISSNAFENLDFDNIKRAYYYVVTVGEMDFEGKSIMEQLYKDMWGTALIDAAHDLLKAKVGELESNHADSAELSSSFGPGYYGMKVEQIRDVFSIVDGEQVGVKLSNGGMMLPQKSLAGFFLAVKDESQLPPEDCQDCIGGSSGCNFCNRWRERQGAANY